MDDVSIFTYVAVYNIKLPRIRFYAMSASDTSAIYEQ